MKIHGYPPRSLRTLTQHSSLSPVPALPSRFISLDVAEGGPSRKNGASTPARSSPFLLRRHAYLSLDCLNGNVAPRHQITSAQGRHHCSVLYYHICVILELLSNLRNLTFLAEFSFIVIQYVRRKRDDILGEDECSRRLFASSRRQAGARALGRRSLPRTARPAAASLASSRVSLKRTPHTRARVSHQARGLLVFCQSLWRSLWKTDYPSIPKWEGTIPTR